MENTINQSLCKNCGICTEVCPNKIIGRNGGIDFIEGREHLCQKCGQCMAICSAKSIHVKGLSYDEDFHELPATKSNPETFFEILSSRRSVRAFKNRPVSEELLDKIVDAVSYAPFGAAPEKMEISIINNRKTIESAVEHIRFSSLESANNILKGIVITRTLMGINYPVDTSRPLVKDIDKTGSFPFAIFCRPFKMLGRHRPCRGIEDFELRKDRTFPMTLILEVRLGPFQQNIH